MITIDPECDAIVRAFSRRETRARAALPVASRDPVFRRKGFSFDLKTIREYQPFDDPRAIDWKLFGRSDRAFVKEYFEEEANGAAVMLDASASMSCFPRAIWETFSYSLCYILLSLGFSLSLHSFSDRLVSRVHAKRKTALRDLENSISGARFEGLTDIGRAARAAKAGSAYKRIFILSDFHDMAFDPIDTGFTEIFLIRFRLSIGNAARGSREIEVEDPETHKKIVSPWDAQAQKRHETTEREAMARIASSRRVRILTDVHEDTRRDHVYRAVADRLYA